LSDFWPTIRMFIVHKILYWCDSALRKAPSWGRKFARFQYDCFSLKPKTIAWCRWTTKWASARPLMLNLRISCDPFSTFYVNHGNYSKIFIFSIYSHTFIVGKFGYSFKHLGSIEIGYIEVYIELTTGCPLYKTFHPNVKVCDVYFLSMIYCYFRLSRNENDFTLTAFINGYSIYAWQDNLCIFVRVIVKNVQVFWPKLTRDDLWDWFRSKLTKLLQILCSWCTSDVLSVIVKSKWCTLLNTYWI
jgi:hypothetical protein